MSRETVPIKLLSFVTSSLVDKVSKVCEGLSILNSLIIDMKTRHKKDKIPMDGDVIPYDFHKYHALGNDYIVIDPNKTKVKLPAHPVKTGQARLELQFHSLNIKPTPIRFTEWS